MKNEKIINWISDMRRFEEYLRERENSEATIKKYLCDIRTFRKYMNGKSRLDKCELLKYKEWLTENYCVNSANSMIAALNQFLIFLEAGWLRIKRIKVQSQGFGSMEKELRKDEFRELVSTARKCGQNQLAMIMETICATGIRISELKFFCADNVKSGAVRVWNKGKHRIVLIPEKLRKKLLLYMAKNEIRRGPVFCTRSGRAKDRSNIWKEMKRLAEKANVDASKVFPHNLRHLFARTFYRITKNLIHLANILGHDSLEVTRTYASEGIDEWKKNLEKLDLIEA